MTLQSNLQLSLLTLGIMAWINYGSCSSRSHNYNQKSFHHSATGPIMLEPSLQLMDKRQFTIPSGKCHTTSVQTSTSYPMIERADSSANNNFNYETVVTCVGLTNLTSTFNNLSVDSVSAVKSIQIFNSSLPILNLDAFRRFSRLQEISITHSSVSLIQGSIPPGIIRLNFSSNHVRHIDSSAFFYSKRTNKSRNVSSPILMRESSHTQRMDDFLQSKPINDAFAAALNETMSSNEVLTETNKDHYDQYEDDPYESTLEEIDLSHNKITEIPPSIFQIKSLKSLRIAGNRFKLDFVWEKLWKWYDMQPDPAKMLPDAADASCGVGDDVHVFQYTVLGVLKARKDMEQTCGSVDRNLCPECSLYALQREGDPSSSSPKSSHGSISISLKIGCASRNLTHLPPIPKHTWQLNISHNFIRDLSPLKELMYEQLLILDGDNNEINLESMVDTPFIQKYNYLSLRNNTLTSIPVAIFSSFETLEGQGITNFGTNFIHCNCEVATKLRPLLFKNSHRIKDMKELYCTEESYGDGHVRVKDLKTTDICPEEPEDTSDEMYIHLVIIIEVLLIILVIAKVWYDQREYRRTGKLPWLSSHMPRLPCDSFLDSVREPLNVNTRPSISLHSSCTNVQSHSAASHLQIIEGGGEVSRSNLSLHSDKSRQCHPLSSHLTSSQTSSV